MCAQRRFIPSPAKKHSRSLIRIFTRRILDSHGRATEAKILHADTEGANQNLCRRWAPVRRQVFSPCGLCHAYSAAFVSSDWLIVLGFNDTSTLVGHFCRFSEKGRKEIEEIVEEMKERDREERGTGMNGNESEEAEEIKTSPSTLTCYKGSRPCPTVSQYHLTLRWRNIAPPDHPNVSSSNWRRQHHENIPI